MNVVSAWLTTCRVIVAEVDFKRIELKLHVADPIQLDRFSVDTEEIEVMLGWLFPRVKGNLKLPFPDDNEVLSIHMEAFTMQSSAAQPMDSQTVNIDNTQRPGRDSNPETTESDTRSS